MIFFERVTKYYKLSNEPALKDISLYIDKGEFVFLIGPSGSGKSTFMRLLLADEVPTFGNIQLSKFDVSNISAKHIPSLRQIVGCVFQDFRLLTKKTVFGNLSFILEITGKRNKEINRIVLNIIDMVGLDGKENRLPNELSGGEQQRLAIARAFINRPLVLIADEPTVNLDSDNIKNIMKILIRINCTGTTVLIATHDYNIVDFMRQRVLELSSGRLIRDEKNGYYKAGD